MMKPSDVKDIVPQMSIWFDRNKEDVAMWTAEVLAKTGDEWRAITWEEIEPFVSDWTENKRRQFKNNLPVLDSEEKARSISMFWRL